jgi:CDP-diacylglycerol--glycerol-3-phosphate 3-phosphatidyltransferase
VTLLQAADFIAAVAVVLLVVVILLVFRLRGSGGETHARVVSTGSSPVAGLGAMNAFYWNMNAIARWLAARGVTANGITWASLVFGLGAGVAFALGAPGMAALLVSFNGIGDLLDGLVARARGTSSNAGEAFDAAVDRYVDEACFAGLAFYFRAWPLLLVVALAAMAGAGMVTLSSAKAEALGVTAPGAMMRRHDRVGVLATGGVMAAVAVPLLLDLGVDSAWAQAPLVLIVVLVAVLGNWSGIRRFVGIARAVRAAEAANVR